LAELEQALSILRGYGGRVTVVFQSLQQIRKLYPETWGLFTAGAILAFRPAGTETGEWLTKKAGDVIVPVLSASDPTSPSDFGPRLSWQQQKRARIPLAKMFAMPQGTGLVWLPGDEVPRVSRLKGFFEIRELDARASANPYYSGDAVRKGSHWKRWLGFASVVIALAVGSAALGGARLAGEALPRAPAMERRHEASSLSQPAAAAHMYLPPNAEGRRVR
jgi:TraM recognition site of TraD and TraG